MKSLIVLAAICLFYGIVLADVNTVNNHDGGHTNPLDVKVPEVPVVDVHKPTQLTQHVVQHAEQHIADVINHHIANKEFLKPTVKVQHIGLQKTDPAKVSVEIPSHVQQIVTQVSQHVPVVISQHVAKQRLIRSPSYRRAFLTEPQYQNHISTEGHKQCDYKCTNKDVPVCGFNGRCYREFESQCLLSKYNCSNALKAFWTVDDILCQNTTTTKCYQGDM